MERCSILALEKSTLVVLSFTELYVLINAHFHVVGWSIKWFDRAERSSAKCPHQGSLGVQQD